MKFPTIAGLIRRRLLVNYRADPAIVAGLLPGPLRPLVHEGHVVVGVCLIRLEQIRPGRLPKMVGISSENAAHRIAVCWRDGAQLREGVFVTRRDTDSRLNCLAGGRVFPGEHHLADFLVADKGKRISVAMKSRDSTVAIEVAGRQTGGWFKNSCFRSLGEASRFHQRGSLGFSATCNRHRLDGLELSIQRWQVAPFEVDHVTSSYFDDEQVFPRDAIAFDHALVMHDIPHSWRGVAPLCI